MEQVSIIGIDTSKRSFQLHGSTAEGCPVFRKTLSRGKLLSFLTRQPPCEIVMEACGGSHYWGREIITLGHVCKLIPPIYVKPFLKRQKNDANDSEAIVEAAQRPTMRFVAVKTEEAQAGSMLFRTRDLLVRQRTQTINSVRGQLAEFGVIAAQGVASVAQLRQGVAEAQEVLPDQVVSMANLLFEQIATFNEKIAGLDRDIRARARETGGDQAPDDDPGRRTDLRDGGECLCAADGELPPGSRLRRLDRADATAEFDGRQATAWPHHKDGTARLAPLAHSGCDSRCLANAPAQGGVGSLAPKDDRANPAEAGRCRTGQQDGPHHLGAVDQERDLPGTGRGWRCGVGDREEKRAGKGTPGSADALLNA